MKEHMPLSEKDLKFMALSNLAKTFIQLGHIASSYPTGDVRRAVYQQRWQVFNMMTEMEQNALTSYQNYIQDQEMREKGADIINGKRPKIS